MIHLRFFIYYILLSYVRRGLCDPLFFFFGMRCAQYKVHAQCSFAALAPHMPCMLLVEYSSKTSAGRKFGVDEKRVREWKLQKVKKTA